MRKLLAVLVLAMVAGCGPTYSEHYRGDAAQLQDGDAGQVETAPEVDAGQPDAGDVQQSIAAPDAGPVASCAGANLGSDVENCGACGHSCTAWLVQQHVQGAGFGAMCLSGTCTVVVSMSRGTPQTCRSVCSAQGLACVARDSCANADGTFTDATNAGCGRYTDPQGFTCQGKAPLGCDDLPPATESCDSASHGTQTGSYAGGECLCG